MISRSEKSCPPGGYPGGSGLEAFCEHESQNDRGEGDTFDEGGGNQHVGADTAGGFRLTGDSFTGLSADLTDATTCADDSEAHSDDSATDADTFVGDDRGRLRYEVNQTDHNELLARMNAGDKYRRFVWEGPVVG
jgi:hypothetical protein